MTAPVHRWQAAPFDREVEASLERLARLPDAVHVAAMPDTHLAHDVCVGVVLATSSQLVPAAVGGDIGCGMAALALDVDADVLADPRRGEHLLAELDRAIPCIKRRRPAALPDALLAPLSHPSLETARARDGRYQLGTLGRGNHFLEFQCDDAGGLWLMVHSGSRGMGVAIRDHHLRRATRASGGLSAIAADSADGHAYRADHDWALAYAAENRRVLAARACDVAESVLGARPLDATWRTCHHNFVRRETHAGRAVWVHRKGAISARDGEPGIIPGSMGASSYHTLGRGHPDALASSSHGAGRALSRTEARRRIGLRDLRRSLRGVVFDVRKERRLVDEAPAAYRDIDAVMRAQRELTRIVRRLRPLVSFKGT